MFKEISVGIIVGLITFISSGIIWPLIKEKYFKYRFKKTTNGVMFDGKFYAWDGKGLDKMEKVESTRPPTGLTDLLEKRNLKVFSGDATNDTRDKIYKMKQTGYYPLYLIDEFKKREVRQLSDQILFVKPQ